MVEGKPIELESNKLRVTFVLNCFVRAPSGGFRVIYEYANRLAELGHQVTVVHEQWREGWRRPFKHVYEIMRDRWHSRKPDGLSRWLWWMPIDPRVHMKMMRRLNTAHLPDSDAVIATYWTTARLLPEIEARHGKPVHLVQLYETWGVKNPTDVDAVLLLNVPKIVVSNHLADTLRYLGVPREQIRVVPNGLDHVIYRPPIHTTKRRGATVSVLLSDSAQKDSPAAITALTLAKQVIPELEVTAFGTARRPLNLPTWIRYSQGLSGSDLTEVYQSTSVYLCSSVSEGWGFPVVEAMACGAAIVSTTNGGVEDFCVHERNALLVSVGDTDSMARAIARLIRDEPLRERLVQAGYETVAPMNWTRSTEQFVAALNSLLT